MSFCLIFAAKVRQNGIKTSKNNAFGKFNVVEVFFLKRIVSDLLSIRNLNKRTSVNLKLICKM